jgi:hypothetical protein
MKDERREGSTAEELLENSLDHTRLGVPQYRMQDGVPDICQVKPPESLITADPQDPPA